MRLLALSRLLVFVVAVGGLTTSTRPAAAWIEKRIVSSSTTLDLDADGRATIRHELALDIRGAPLTSFALDGIDDDAEPLADATVTRMKGSIATSLPLPVQVTASGGRLELSVPLRQGFRGRAFILRFGYRTHLRERGLIRSVPAARASELSWLGPRFDDGVDSVTLTIRTAAAARAPEAAADVNEAAGGPLANFGIVMSTLRRSQQRDELELVRAHVARDEAITWRVLLDASLFPALAPKVAAGAAEPAFAGPEPEPRSLVLRELPLESHLPWLVLGGLLYGLLVRIKTWSVQSAAVLRECRPRPLTPWRASVRAALAGVSLSGAAALVIWSDFPSLAAALLLAAVAFASERSPRSVAAQREVGVWQPQALEALGAKPAPALPGAWLDAGRLPGFLLLMAALASVIGIAARLFETSPYYGASVLLACVALLPIFCTGRAGQLPLDARSHSQRFLGRAHRRLSRLPELVVTPIGRVDASGEPQELRLAIAPERGLPGLIGMELGLEFHARLGGFSARPVVVVRAADGSACQRALPRGLRWARGRKNDERATLIRPKLPTLGQSIALIQELLAVVRLETRDASKPSRSKASKSSGRGLSTAKAGTRSSPAHAT